MKFVVDGMLGSLARRLRVLGFDTVYDQNLDDRALLKIARGEERVLVTKDTELSRVKGIESILVAGEEIMPQLKKIISSLGLTLKPEDFFSRCLVCNSKIEPVAKEKVADRVPPKARAAYNDYWICRNCDKVYWQGTHWENMKREIETLLNSPPIPLS